VEQALLGYSWPGNIRELKHTLERACILASRAMIVCGDLFEDRAYGDVSAADGVDNLNRYLYACQRAHITRALEKHSWHIGNTAAGLGISRKNLWEKMKKLEIHEKS
jgi:DNA-binding NtrC family response regulator